MVVALMIIPLPTFFMDILLTVNISISLTLVLIAIYMPSALHLSAYPSILLVTTLFRLALNVSSTRLILLYADAGEVITSFGNFVVAGNMIVGAIIFLILMLINFIVIAKGSERVSEVAARFTLDAMPGKQMSIDADMRAGAIDMDEGRKRRRDLERESQLFGAMDGAMKFVKGDSIAGIIITVINVLGGIVIGVTMMGMTAGEAASKYAMLTIGDGLVSSIPSLLISVSAGIIVTRVTPEVEGSNLGSDIGQQLLANYKPFFIISGLLVLLALVPGLPKVPFIILSAGVGFLGYSLKKTREPKTLGAGGDDAAEAPEELPPESRPAPSTADKKKKKKDREPQELVPIVTPIAMEVSNALTPFVDSATESGDRFLNEMLPLMKEGLFYELGVIFPGVRVRGFCSHLPDDTYILKLNEVPVAVGQVPLGKVLVNESADRLAIMNVAGEPTVNPANGMDACWIPADKKELVEQSGYTTWDTPGYMILHLSSVLRRFAYEFVGIQEVQSSLDKLEQAFPALIKEVVPKVLSLQQFTDVCRRLVEEEISIVNLKAIMEALAEWAQVEKDPVMLTEYVRMSMKRYITYKYSKGGNTLVVYLLDPQIEQAIKDSIQITSSGNYLALEPEIAQDILDAVRVEIGDLPATAQQPVILTNVEIRRYFRQLVKLEFPYLAVLSFQELNPDMNIQPVARISVRR
ncbi:MAG: type III secretion system export apparatus subunit SctV [Myxococcales bacterium]|nr:type III secretion system export apparatus subunit SctV [Myxococcales bacterium]MCB9643075.1 type III secretion system export apparatus subunit SctV [Myxococcales bacterium]